MRLLALTTLLIAIKATVLALDPTVRLYLGDSVAYLAGAQREEWMPRDRSFVFAYLLRALVWWLGPLSTLLLWQALAGVAISLLLYSMLVRRLNVSPGAAAMTACALALEPAQLFYERMVLAESAGLLAFVAFCAASLLYLASQRAVWLPLIALLGLTAASLRLNYLPVVLVLSGALPFLPLVDRGRSHGYRTLLTHALLALVCGLAVHLAYRQFVSVRFDVPPAYLARAGFMQMGLVAPLIQPEHLERAGLPADLELAFPLSDRHARMAHMWKPGGLAHELRRRKLDLESIARDLSDRAVRDNPLGLVRLGVLTLGDYFREESIGHALDNDLGRREIPADALYGLREDWGYDAVGVPWKITPVSRYFELGTWWLVACLYVLAPLALVSVIRQWHTPQRLPAVFVGLASLGLVAAHILFVNVALYRYLHPLPFFVLLTIVPLLRASAPEDVA